MVIWVIGIGVGGWSSGIWECLSGGILERWEVLDRMEEVIEVLIELL